LTVAHANFMEKVNRWLSSLADPGLKKPVS
jgi:hypothetical protein